MGKELRLNTTKVRAHLSEIVNMAAYAGQITIVMRHGRELAAIVPSSALHDELSALRAERDDAVFHEQRWRATADASAAEILELNTELSALRAEREWRPTLTEDRREQFVSAVQAIWNVAGRPPSDTALLAVLDATLDCLTPSPPEATHG